MIEWLKNQLKQSPPNTTKQRGDGAEALALAHLQRAGLVLVVRNFKTPGRGGGEIDLIMRDVDRCLVFVEVRWRASDVAGGALASITATKRKRIVFAARHYLSRLPHMPQCRFDVVAIGDGSSSGGLTWIKSAFDADQ